MKINCLSFNWRPPCSSSVSSCGPAAGVISLCWLILLCRIWEGYRALLSSDVTTSSLCESFMMRNQVCSPFPTQECDPIHSLLLSSASPKDQTQGHPILISWPSDWSPGNPYCNPMKEGAPLLWSGWGAQCTNSSLEGKVPYKYFLCIFYTL